jgi:sugar phosphate isomerase/epimerase
MAGADVTYAGPDGVVAVQDHSDIGISTGAYLELPLGVALSRIAELAPFAEVCSWGYHSLLAPENERAIAATGLPFTVHGPFTHEGLGSRFESRRRAAMDLHRRTIWVASELGARLYVVHPDLQRRRRPWNPRIAAALERSFAELRALQDDLGLPILVENMPFSGRSHYTAPGELDLQGLGLTLDVGHAAMTGTLRRWLGDTSVPLRHVHLHSNQGHTGGDLHHALGTGVVDAAPALAKARAAGATVVLEHTNEAAVVASLEHLRIRGLMPALVG